MALIRWLKAQLKSGYIGEIPSGATAPGLEEARERLKLDSMTKDEQEAYYRYLDSIVILRDNIYTERAKGHSR